MNHAALSDFEEVKNIFYQYRDIFPHIRTDYMMRQIEGGHCILQDGVVITYNFYKRPQQIGTAFYTTANRYHCILHQIVKDSTKDTSAGLVLQEFFKSAQADVWLSVRRDNVVAKKFYERQGMELVGECSWADETLPGDVYLHQRTLNIWDWPIWDPDNPAINREII